MDQVYCTDNTLYHYNINKYYIIVIIIIMLLIYITWNVQNNNNTFHFVT